MASKCSGVVHGMVKSRRKAARRRGAQRHAEPKAIIKPAAAQRRRGGSDGKMEAGVYMRGFGIVKIESPCDRRNERILYIVSIGCFMLRHDEMRPSWPASMAIILINKCTWRPMRRQNSNGGKPPRGNALCKFASASKHHTAAHQQSGGNPRRRQSIR